MGLTTFRFFFFAMVLLLAYYCLPKRVQWCVLLAGNLVFYSFAGIKHTVFILITVTSAFFAARWMEHTAQKSKEYLKANKESLSKEERKQYKEKTKKHRQWIMTGTLVLNFGLLCVFKYCNFIILQINRIIRIGGLGPLDFWNLVIPLGISFYTFTTMGYVVDVYWEKTEAQKNPLKLLLFTSFFPQITQGPISDYRQLAPQLYAEHELKYHNISWGFQRFVWGLAKKMILADTAAIYVAEGFAAYPGYTGISTLIVAFMYSIQIYADFSGYMDMMCGFCEMLGITLVENFEQPYFSRSVAEYWRRWHISLGNWFKTYIYYPIAVSGFARNAGKKAQAKFGKRFGKDIPATIALLVTWFATGLWHGASSAYISWGLVNGMFIIATLWLEPFYEKSRNALHIKADNTWWILFQTVRTFFLVTLIKVLPEVGGLRAGLGLIKNIFTNHKIPADALELMPFTEQNSYIYVFWILFMCVILFFVSLVQYRKKIPVRTYFNKLPWICRILILAAVCILAIEFSAYSGGTNGDFLYAQF